MRKEAILIVILILIIILNLFINFQLTGYAIASEQTEVLRLVEGNKVKLSIISNQNVIAIKENLSYNCSPLNYLIHPNISLSDFNQDENIWILANEYGFDVELIYTLAEGCEVYSGIFYIISNDTLSSKETSYQEDAAEASSDNRGSGGGSIASTTPTTQEGIASQEIKETQDEEEYTDLREKARKIIGLKESEEIQTLPFLAIIILSTTGIAILIILIILIIRKPKRK
ncbi:MAG: hypothetical protein ACP5D2_01310 [Candidatus Nanoarchaeia archaeon]